MFLLGKNDKINNKNELTSAIKENFLLDFSNSKKQIDEKTVRKYVDGDINIVGNELEIFNFKDNKAEILSSYILQEYPDFFNKSAKKQNDIICVMFEYLFQNKRVNSNWIVHFLYLIKNSNSNIFDINFFKNDENYGFCVEDALNIIELYLILFRLQNYYLEPIDFENVDSSGILIGDFETYTFVEKQTTKIIRKEDVSCTVARNMVLCEIIRNSLSHGNLKTTLINTDNQIKKLYIFEDIFKDKKKTLYLNSDGIKDFISSDCFKPKNTKLKTNQI